MLSLFCKMDGTIVAPKQISAWDGTDGENWLKFRNLTKFNIMGSGIFDGRGQNWWTCKKQNICTTVPDISKRKTLFLNRKLFVLSI